MRSIRPGAVFPHADGWPSAGQRHSHYYEPAHLLPAFRPARAAWGGRLDDWLQVLAIAGVFAAGLGFANIWPMLFSITVEEKPNAPTNSAA